MRANQRSDEEMSGASCLASALVAGLTAEEYRWKLIPRGGAINLR
jgi:hypothetical protein